MVETSLHPTIDKYVVYTNGAITSKWQLGALTKKITLQRNDKAMFPIILKYIILREEQVNGL